MNNSANETLKARAQAWTSPYKPVTIKCAYQIKEPVIINININEMRFKEKDMRKMRNIEKRSRTTIKHFNLKLLVVLFVIVQ